MKSARRSDAVGTLSRDGFTLIEIIVVIAVISILAGLLLGVSKYADRATKRARAKSDVEGIANRLSDYFVENGRFPASLKDITNMTAALSYDTNGLPLDPWGNPYEYSISSAISYRLYSLGPDMTNDADNIIAGK